MNHYGPIVISQAIGPDIFGAEFEQERIRHMSVVNDELTTIQSEPINILFIGNDLFLYQIGDDRSHRLTSILLTDCSVGSRCRTPQGGNDCFSPHGGYLMILRSSVLTVTAFQQRVRIPINLQRIAGVLDSGISAIGNLQACVVP